MKKVLIVGANGNFGRRVCRRLNERLSNDVSMILASRTVSELDRLKQELRMSNKEREIVTAPCDLNNMLQFESDVVHKFRPTLLLHTAGPFQRMNSTETIKDMYKVPLLCIKNKVHYLDLSDSYEFIREFHAELNEQAKLNKVILITGASTTPGVTNSVLNHCFPAGESKSKLKSVDIYLSPGNNLPRGLATTRGVLSYLGKPVRQIRRGRNPTFVNGWQEEELTGFWGIGKKRLTAVVDVPDNEIIPNLYPGLVHYSFKAGLELKLLQVSISAMSRVAHLVDFTSFAGLLLKLSNVFFLFGSEDGAMKIVMKEEGNETVFSMYGKKNGPETPIIPMVEKTLELFNQYGGDESQMEKLYGANVCVGDVYGIPFPKVAAYFESLSHLDEHFIHYNFTKRNPSEANYPFISVFNDVSIAEGSFAKKNVAAFLRLKHFFGKANEKQSSITMVGEVNVETSKNRVVYGICQLMFGFPSKDAKFIRSTSIKEVGSGNTIWSREYSNNSDFRDAWVFETNNLNEPNGVDGLFNEVILTKAKFFSLLLQYRLIPVNDFEFDMKLKHVYVQLFGLRVPFDVSLVSPKVIHARTTFESDGVSFNVRTDWLGSLLLSYKGKLKFLDK